MARETKPTNRWQYLRKVFRQTLHSSSWPRDLVIYGGLALLTLFIQIKAGLVPDWRTHRVWWVLSYLIPYGVFILLHVGYRFVEAPWRIHQELEVGHGTALDEIATQITTATNENAMLRERITRQTFPDNRPQISVDRWGHMEQGGVARAEMGFYITNHGDSAALEVAIEEIELGGDKWNSSQIPSLGAKQKDFLIVSRENTAGGRYALVEAFRGVRSQLSIKVKYRDFNRNRYHSVVKITPVVNFGGLEIGPPTQEALGSF